MTRLSNNCCLFITDKYTTFENNNVNISVQVQQEFISTGVEKVPFFYEINLEDISDINPVSSHISNLSIIKKDFSTTAYILLGSKQIKDNLDPYQYESSLRRILLDLSHFEFDIYVAFPKDAENYNTDKINRASKIRSIVSSLCEESFEKKFYITYIFDKDFVSNLFLIKKSIVSHFCKVNNIYQLGARHG